MVREIKKTPFRKKLEMLALSPFALPVLMFLFVIVTLPIIYLTSQRQQDIRQHAASLITSSIAINTDDISYQKASTDVITDTLTISALIILLIIIAICTVLVIFYRKRLSPY